MATYTSNYGWTKPSGSDNVDISVLNDNLDDQDSVIHDAFLNMAPVFSEQATYAVGDKVLYETTTYKCHTAVTTAGSWTGSTNWQVYKLSEGGGGTYADLPDKPSINGNELSGNKTGAQLGLMASDGVVANPTGQTTGTLTALEVGGTKYAVGGGGGTSDYPDLTNKPQINGVTLTGNKTTSELGIDKTAVGLGNVPNVSTNDQTPTFTEASTRNNIASGEKLSVIMGKVQKFFNDLKTVAFTGNASDLNYDNTDSGLSATDVQGAVDELAESYPADKVMMSDGVTSVEDKVDELTDYVVDTTTISGVKISKMGHLVMLSIDKNITMNASQWVNVGTVPYKPTTEIFGVAKQNAVDKIISIDLPTSGVLFVMGSGTSTILVRGSLTYLTSD